MVGDFIPGNMFDISGTTDNGAFKRIYLFSFAFFTALIRNNSLCKICCLIVERFLLLTTTASLFVTISTSFSPFKISVLPVLISK